MSRLTNSEMVSELLDEAIDIASEGDRRFLERLHDAADWDDMNGYDEQRLRNIYQEAFGL